jgi:hypothetical protein
VCALSSVSAEVILPAAWQAAVCLTIGQLPDIEAITMSRATGGPAAPIPGTYAFDNQQQSSWMRGFSPR